MRCQKCGNLVNDNEKICNFCGAPIVPEDPNKFSSRVQNIVPPQEMKKGKQKKIIQIIIIIATVAVVGFLIYYFIIRDVLNIDYSEGFAPVQIVYPDASENNTGTTTKTNTTEPISVTHAGYTFTLPAGFTVYSDSEYYLEAINSSTKVDFVIYDPVEVNYSVIKENEEYVVSLLQARGYTVDEKSEKFINEKSLYVLYCSNKKNPYYLVYVAYDDDTTFSFSIESSGGATKDELLTLVNSVASSAKIAS